MNTHNPSNPFQIPSCFQRADLQQRRRKRVKKVVIGLIVTFATLLVVLLIEGCMTEHARASVVATQTGGIRPNISSVAVVIAGPKSDVTLQKNLTASRMAMPLASKITPAVVIPAGHGIESIYMVRSGDTLARIARQHKLTVQFLKSVNDLNKDNIVVGMRLKLPTA